MPLTKHSSMASSTTTTSIVTKRPSALFEPMEVEVGQPDGRRDKQQHDHFSHRAGSGNVALDCLEHAVLLSPFSRLLAD